MANNHYTPYQKKGLTALQEKRYFDAHEDWEIPWKEMRGYQKLFWQTMILLSVGAYHYSNDNLTGCRNLWNKAVNKCNQILEKGKANNLTIIKELKDILENCLKALANNTSPLPIIENAAQHIISEKWFEFLSP